MHTIRTQKINLKTFPTPMRSSLTPKSDQYTTNMARRDSKVVLVPVE